MDADYAGGVNDSGDGATDDGSSGNGAVPRLTIGQRVLASLPNLQRQTPAAPPSSPPGPTRGTGRTPADGGGGDVVTPDEVLAPGDGSPTRSRMRDAFMKPPEPRPQRGAPSGMDKDELTQIIKRVDDREQVLAYSSAALGVVVGVALTIGAVHFNPPVHHKNHESTGFILFDGGARVVLAAVVVLAAWNRRRSFVAFALLFLGTTMGFPFALPFWALGVWMIFRVLKWQRELAALTGGPTRTRAQPAARTRTRPQPAARGRDAAEARRRARAERMSARGAGGRRAKKQPEPAGPPPNKRYTPPKPPRPRPPSP